MGTNLKIKVGRHWYYVKETTVLPVDNALGVTNLNDFIVLLDSNHTDECLKDTLWHELAHAVLSETGFHRILEKTVDHDSFEAFVDKMGEVLMDTFTIKKKKGYINGKPAETSPTLR